MVGSTPGAYRSIKKGDTMDIKVLNGEYQYKFNKTRYEACIKKAQRRVNKYNMNLRKYRQLAKMWTKAFYVSLGFAAIPFITYAVKPRTLALGI